VRRGARLIVVLTAVVRVRCGHAQPAWCNVHDAMPCMNVAPVSHTDLRRK
jgi:hypothetical protein